MTDTRSTIELSLNANNDVGIPYTLPKLFYLRLNSMALMDSVEASGRTITAALSAGYIVNFDKWTLRTTVLSLDDTAVYVISRT